MQVSERITRRFRLFAALGLIATGLVTISLATSAALADPESPGRADRPITKTVTLLLPRDHLSRHPIDDQVSEHTLTLFLKALDPWKVYFYQSDIDGFQQYADRIDDLLETEDLSPAYVIFKTFLKRIDERVKTVDEILDSPLDFTRDEDLTVDKDSMTYPKTPEEARDQWRKRVKYDLLVLRSEDSEKAKEKEEKDQQEASKPSATNGAAATSPAADTASDKSGPALQLDDAEAKKPTEAEPESKSVAAATDEGTPVDRIRRRYHSFAKRMHQTNSEELLETYLNCVTGAYDPHTSYMSPDTYENFEISMRLELEGIGASLQSIDGYTVVNEIIPGGAADKNGQLKPEDRIVAVGQGENGAMIDTIDMKLTDVVKMIRGKEGTVVRLAISPTGSDDRKIVKITRAKIELKDKEAHGEVFEVGHRADGAPLKVGVIDLPSFYMDMEAAKRGVPDFRSTTRDVREILEDFKAHGVDAVVLDLRRNGGGSLTEAINLTGLFIPEGPVVQVKDSDGEVKTYYDLDPTVVWAGPLIVVTSKFSASASEILAGAIQDWGRGLIVGDHSTHGKGTVQSLQDLGQRLFQVSNAPAMGALKVTMQQFYRPNGESTQKRGVLADVELPQLTTYLDVGEADLDYPLAFDKVTAASFQSMNMVDPAVRDQLRKQSEKRCSQSEDFQKVRRNIARYLEQKQRKTVSLNEEKFLKERAEINADREEEKTYEELNDNSGIKRDFYLDEVLAIAADYLNLRQVAKTH